MAIRWDFDNSADGWVGGGEATLTPGTYLSYVPLLEDHHMRSPTGLTIVGAVDYIVQCRIRRTAGEPLTDPHLGAADFFYQTVNHPMTEDFYNRVEAGVLVGSDFMILRWDMSDLYRGGRDWLTSTITRIRFDFDQAITSEFEIDWVSVGPPIGRKNLNRHRTRR